MVADSKTRGKKLNVPNLKLAGCRLKVIMEMEEIGLGDGGDWFLTAVVDFALTAEPRAA